MAETTESAVAWELTDRDGASIQGFIHEASPVFRRDSLDRFLATFLEAHEDREYQGELSMLTLLRMVGALIDADGSRKNVLADLLDANVRGFSERSLDKYLAAASDAYEKARPHGQAKRK